MSNGSFGLSSFPKAGSAQIVKTVYNQISEPFGIGGGTAYGTPGTYTFTVPQGITKIRVFVWGAGGSGSVIRYYGNGVINQSVNITTGATAGAGGGFSCGEYSVSPGQTFSVVVGAGGALRTTGTAASPNSSINGIAGGSSSFGSVITATGGAGGTTGVMTSSYLAISLPASTGGTAVGGNILNYSGGNTGATFLESTGSFSGSCRFAAIAGATGPSTWFYKAENSGNATIETTNISSSLTAITGAVTRFASPSLSLNSTTTASQISTGNINALFKRQGTYTPQAIFNISPILGLTITNTGNIQLDSNAVDSTSISASYSPTTPGGMDAVPGYSYIVGNNSSNPTATFTTNVAVAASNGTETFGPGGSAIFHYHSSDTSRTVTVTAGNGGIGAGGGSAIGLSNGGFGSISYTITGGKGGDGLVIVQY